MKIDDFTLCEFSTLSLDTLKVIVDTISIDIKMVEESIIEANNDVEGLYLLGILDGLKAQKNKWNKIYEKVKLGKLLTAK